MVTLQGTSVYLRALEPEDLDFVYQIENDESIWEISSTQTPYSRFLVRQYLENAHQDIYEAKQLRLVICLNDTFEAVGLIDLFEFVFLLTSLLFQLLYIYKSSRLKLQPTALIIFFFNFL